jgi:hypothetical protein
MTKFYLVKFSCNWSDEFDVKSVSVCDSVRYEHEKQFAADHADLDIGELCFGTNESFTDMTFGELFECFKFLEISESTYLELQHTFVSTYSEGYGTWFQWPSSVYHDEAEEDDD